MAAHEGDTAAAAGPELGGCCSTSTAAYRPRPGPVPADAYGVSDAEFLGFTVPRPGW
jgi:hypothetical protein